MQWFIALIVLIISLSKTVTTGAAADTNSKRNAEPHLQFLTEPNSQFVAPDGGRAVFKCVPAPAGATINWLHNGVPLYQSSSVLRISRHKLVLKLPNSVKHGQTGGANSDNIYDYHNSSSSGNTVGQLPNDQQVHVSQLLSGANFQCIAQYKGRSIISQTAKLIVAELKPFANNYSKNLSLIAIAGNTAVIPCQPPHSVPNAVTEFVVNNSKIIDKTSERYRLMPSGDLQIFSVGESDAGIYRCIAHNPFLQERTSEHHYIELTVIRQPSSSSRHHHNSNSQRNHNHHNNNHQHSHHHQLKFVVIPKAHVTAVTGSNVTFECVASGSPMPKIVWKRSVGQLPKGRHSMDGGNLILSNVRRGDDGTYVCHAANGSPNHAISANSVLEIQEIPQFMRKTLIEEKEVMEGQEIILECSTKGKPKPVVDWFHNGAQVTPEVSNKNGIVIKGTDGSKLSILNANNQLHSGIYQCFATNDLDSIYATTVVNVVSLTKTQDAPDVSVNVNNKESPINESDNDADIVDNTDDQEIVDEDDDLFDRHPSHPKKGKNKNKGIKMVPPTKPEVTRLSEDSVMVRWDVPQNDGLPILFYKVQHREMANKNSDWNTVDDDIAPHIHSYAVGGLKSGMKYRFRIAAVYSNNDNKLSPNSIKFTLFKEPPMKKPINGPVIVHAEPVSQSAITIKWDHYDIDHVSIDGFFIYYRPSDFAGDYYKVAVMGAITRSHIITHLLPDKQYDIKMQCFNVAGTSEFSNIFMVKTLPKIDTNKEKENKKNKEIDNNNIGNGIGPVTGDKDKTLYTVVFITSGALILVFVVCICLCFVRHKNQTPRSKGSTTKLPKEKHPKAGGGGANNHNSLFSHSNHTIFAAHHRSNGHISNTLIGAAASNGYLSRSSMMDNNEPYPHNVNIRVNPFCEISNGGSTLNRTASINGSLRSKSISQHHLSSTAASVTNNNESSVDVPLSMSTMERRKLKRTTDDHYPGSTLNHSSSRLNHHQHQQHSTSFTRLNGTLERKRRSRTDLLNAGTDNNNSRSDNRDNHNNHNHHESIITNNKCNGLLHNSVSNGPLVIMQSSC
ncbi:interference hedgehog-like [Oppia nitens]|uniref:interference hedgehog-like n=1 Tax=Oppia nitens TaxID=1686743 RepID=UPI0023DC0E02|nr:interference hedgehog-like [Oppia nitens]